MRSVTLFWSPARFSHHLFHPYIFRKCNLASNRTRSVASWPLVISVGRGFIFTSWLRPPVQVHQQRRKIVHSRRSRIRIHSPRSLYKHERTHRRQTPVRFFEGILLLSIDFRVFLRSVPTIGFFLQKQSRALSKTPKYNTNLPVNGTTRVCDHWNLGGVIPNIARKRLPSGYLGFFYKMVSTNPMNDISLETALHFLSPTGYESMDLCPNNIIFLCLHRTEAITDPLR